MFILFLILFFIVAVLTVVFKLAHAASVAKSANQSLRRSEILSVIATVVLVVVGLLAQRTAQQATSAVIENDLNNILTKQQTEFEKQAQRLEAAQKQLDETLEQARILERRQQEQTKAQEEQTTALGQQQKSLQEVLVSQTGEIELLSRIPLNRNLMGIEISYSPTQEKWNEIARAYNRIKSPEPDLPYANAPMIAESDGEYWKIDFEPTLIPPYITPDGRRMGGYKKLRKLSTKDNPLFTVVLREALIGLRILWGNGTETQLSPDQAYYPSAMYVSRKRISFILRPPLVLWSLNELYDNAVVTFFGKDYPIDVPTTFTIHSLDPGVALDQTIELDWSKRIIPKPPDVPSYDQFMNRKISGPHRLMVKFDVFDPRSGRRYFRPANHAVR
jgi:TolA-binding protein